MVRLEKHPDNLAQQQSQRKKVKQPGRWFRPVSVLVFIVLTSAIAGVGVWSSWQQANQNVDQRLNSSLTYLNSWLDDQNTSNKIAAEGLASQRNVVAALMQHERGKPELDRLLAVGLLQKLDVSFIAFIDSDRKIIASDPADLPQEWLPKTTVEAALAGQPLPAGATLGENKLLLTASASIQNENQTVGAVILGDLLDDTTTTAVDLKRATGLDVAIVLKGKFQATTLPPLSGSKYPVLPDLSGIEATLKSQEQIISDLRLSDQAYKVGYKAILSNRFLIGEVLLLLPQSEIDQVLWQQIIPIIVVLFISWLIGGLVLFYFFTYYLPSLTFSIVPSPLLTSQRKDIESFNNLAPLENSSSQKNLIEVAEPALTSWSSRTDSGVILSEKNLQTLPQQIQPGGMKVEPDPQPAHKLEEVATPSLTSNRQDERDEATFGNTSVWEYFGKLAINRTGYEVKLADQPLSMTRTEFELLCVLAARPNKVISRNDLISLVWGEDYLGEPGTVDAHISNLRRKIEADPTKPAMIVTVRGVGYKFQPPL